MEPVTASDTLLQELRRVEAYQRDFAEENGKLLAQAEGVRAELERLDATRQDLEAAILTLTGGKSERSPDMERIVQEIRDRVTRVAEGRVYRYHHPASARERSLSIESFRAGAFWAVQVVEGKQ